MNCRNYIRPSAKGCTSFLHYTFKSSWTSFKDTYLVLAVRCIGSCFHNLSRTCLVEWHLAWITDLIWIVYFLAKTILLPGMCLCRISWRMQHSFTSRWHKQIHLIGKTVFAWLFRYTETAHIPPTSPAFYLLNHAYFICTFVLLPDSQGKRWAHCSNRFLLLHADFKLQPVLDLATMHKAVWNPCFPRSRWWLFMLE